MEDEIVLPVFPLPDVIFFPRTMLPLHIFEDRYREMIKDLQEKPKDERLIIISKMDNQNLPKGKNPFANIATVGRLVHVEYLEDGRSNVVLYGQYTAEVEEILPSPNSYRMARVKTIRDEFWSDPMDDHSEHENKLMKSVQSFMERTNSKIKNLENVSVEDLVNGLAFSLNIQGSEKQKLLETQVIDKRLEELVEIVDKIGYYSEFVPDEDKYDKIN